MTPTVVKRDQQETIQACREILDIEHCCADDLHLIKVNICIYAFSPP